MGTKTRDALISNNQLQIIANWMLGGVFDRLSSVVYLLAMTLATIDSAKILDGCYTCSGPI